MAKMSIPEEGGWRAFMIQVKIDFTINNYYIYKYCISLNKCHTSNSSHPRIDAIGIVS